MRASRIPASASCMPARRSCVRSCPTWMRRSSAACRFPPMGAPTSWAISSASRKGASIRCWRRAWSIDPTRRCTGCGRSGCAGSPRRDARSTASSICGRPSHPSGRRRPRHAGQLAGGVALARGRDPLPRARARHQRQRCAASRACGCRPRRANTISRPRRHRLQRRLPGQCRDAGALSRAPMRTS